MLVGVLELEKVFGLKLVIVFFLVSEILNIEKFRILFDIFVYIVYMIMFIDGICIYDKSGLFKVFYVVIIYFKMVEVYVLFGIKFVK